MAVGSIESHNAAVRRFVDRLAGDRSGVVDNVSAEITAVEVGGLALPVSLDSPAPGECFVTSARTGLVEYPRLEAAGAGWPVRAAVGAVTSGFDGLLSLSRLDRPVQINNWLTTSAFPHEALDPALIAPALGARWPDRPFVMRGLVDGIHDDLARRFRSAGWSLVLTREVWLADPASRLTRRKRDVTRDARFLRSRPLTARTPETEADWRTAVDLYRRLYLDKYGALNPAYGPGFLRLMHETGVWRVSLMEDRGEPLAMYARTEGHGWRAFPAIGYDATRPAEEGLYRRLTAHLQAEALADGVRLHMSSGVGRFKAHRGAVRSWDRSAVHAAHLPRFARLGADALTTLLNASAKALYDRFGG